MADIVKAASPPFLFTYWNPFRSDSNLVGSWFDYVKDVSVAKYTADSVGRYIQETSSEQITAIESTGHRICGVLYGLQEELEKATKELQGVNQRLDMVLDEAKTSNLLHENIAELLRIPDSQKQRQHHIEMSLKFLKNALKDQDLYQDALRELLEAEELMPSDYFVLHRIGMIYLYVPALGNLEKALDYFVKAGKYAFVESHPDAVRLSNILSKNVTIRFAEQAELPSTDVSALAAESFLEAGTSLYALGRFEEASKMAEKAAKCHPDEAKYHFFTAKYLTRSGNPDSAVPQLQKATELVPEMALAALGDFDLNKAKPILDLLNRLDAEVKAQLQRGIELLKGWPQADHRSPDIQQWMTDAQGSLEHGSYAQKRLLVAKLKGHEGNLPFAPKLAEIAVYGVEFDRSLAEKLLRKNNPKDTQKQWLQRRNRNLIENPYLRKLAEKPELSFVELVLLATADKSNFVPAGTIRWTTEVPPFDYQPDGTIGDDGTLYVSGNTQKGRFLYAVDGQTGKKLWEFEPEHSVTDPPAIGANGMLYFTTDDERIYALDGHSGKQLWEYRATGLVNGGCSVGADGTVYFGSGSGRVYALDGHTGKKRWLFSTEDSVYGALAIGAAGTVYFGSNDTVYALDGQTGKKLWEFKTEDDVCSDPAIGADGTVYIGTQVALCALNGETGKKIWEFKKHEIISHLAIGAQGTVYYASGDLNALDGQTGKHLWEFEKKDFESVNEAPIIGADGTVYFGSSKNVFALDGQTGEKIWEFKGDSLDNLPFAIGLNCTLYVASGMNSDGEHNVYGLATVSCGSAMSPWSMSRGNARRTGCAGKPHNTASVSKQHAQEIKRLMAAARAAEAAENAKWLRKKDFSRARELYSKAVALGCVEAKKMLDKLAE